MLDECGAEHEIVPIDPTKGENRTPEFLKLNPTGKLPVLVDGPIERELGDGPYLFGDWFTAADVMIGSMFVWKRMWAQGPDRPKLEAYTDRLLARPAAPKLGG